MPSNILTADTSFPDLTGEGKSEEKFAKISSYLYMLLEQLRYSMTNLDKENFNKAGFDEIMNIITEPVYLQLKDANGNITALQVTAEGLGARISNAEGDIQSLVITADSLYSQITSAEGEIHTLQSTATSLSSRIQGAEGSISELSQTVNGMTLSVVNGSKSSTIKLLANEAVISSANISFDGVVTFRDLSRVDEKNPTVINGGNITTGTITAIDLEGCVLKSVFKPYEGQVGEIQMWYQDKDGGRHLAGGLYIDGNGDVNADEGQSKYRIYLYSQTVEGQAAALKLSSDAGISLNAGTRIAIEAKTGLTIATTARKADREWSNIEITAPGEIHINGTNGVYINGSKYSSGGVSWGE